MKLKHYILSALIVTAITFRIFLPYLALHYLNSQLNQSQNYSGHISNLDISILTGSINLKKVDIRIKNYPDHISIFKTDSIKISIHFLPAVMGKIIIDTQMSRPELNYIIGSSFPVEKIPSANIVLKKIKIINGKFNLINLKDAPPFKIYATNINVIFNQIPNSKLYQVNIDAKVMNSGDFTMMGKLIPFKKGPYFYIESSIKSLDITTLNKVLKHYTDVKVSKGEFSIFLEISAKNNIISGYIKPFIKNLTITEQDKDNIAHKIYKKAVELGTKILENPKNDTIATKINIHGNIEDPNINNFPVIWYLMQHAFMQALIPEIDHQFSFQDINYNKQDNKKNPHYKP